MIKITQEAWEEIQDQLLWLEALEDAGVDNWEGIDEAHSIYEELKGD